MPQGKNQTCSHTNLEFCPFSVYLPRINLCTVPEASAVLFYEIRTSNIVRNRVQFSSNAALA